MGYNPNIINGISRGHPLNPLGWSPTYDAGDDPPSRGFKHQHCGDRSVYVWEVLISDNSHSKNTPGWLVFSGLDATQGNFTSMEVDLLREPAKMLWVTDIFWGSTNLDMLRLSLADGCGKPSLPIGDDTRTIPVFCMSRLKVCEHINPFYWQGTTLICIWHENENVISSAIHC